MASDRQRRELYVALEATLGGGPAQTLMELLPPFDWSDVARRSDIAELRGEVAELRGEIGGVKGQIGGLRSEMVGGLAEVRAEIRAQFAKYLLSIFTIVLALAGVVIAAT